MNERAKFRKGEQKEFLRKIRETTSWSWEYIAKICKCNKETVRTSFYYEKRTMPYRAVQRLSVLSNVKIPRVNILSKNWGQLKVGRQNFKNIKVNTKTKEFAELVFILMRILKNLIQIILLNYLSN